MGWYHGLGHPLKSVFSFFSKVGEKQGSLVLEEAAQAESAPC